MYNPGTRVPGYPGTRLNRGPGYPGPGPGPPPPSRVGYPDYIYIFAPLFTVLSGLNISSGGMVRRDVGGGRA